MKRVLISSIAVFVLASAVTASSLKVHPVNPLYLIDRSGKTIYLGGHQIFVDLQDNTFCKHTTYDNHPVLDWSWYLRFATERGLNFIRSWTELSTGIAEPGCAIASPMPYRRIPDSGRANDGGFKFDLEQFDAAFFDRMRSRIADAGKHGIYVSVMLFEVYAFAELFQKGNVFNSANNVNGIEVDTNGDGWGVEMFTAPSPRIRELQKAYVERVIDTVNDYDNVIYEIANEVGAPDWQLGVIRWIREYESTKPKQHLIYSNFFGLTSPDRYTGLGQREALSAADMFAVNPTWDDYWNVFDSPPVNNAGKPGIFDRDHIGVPDVVAPLVAWKAFTRGYHYTLYDAPFETPEVESQAPWDLARWNIGKIVHYANNRFQDLSKVVPRGDLTSTTYALASPGTEYLVFQPEHAPFTLSLGSGGFTYEWFDPNTATVVETGTVVGSPFRDSFSIPPSISGAAVLYIRSTSLPGDPVTLKVVGGSPALGRYAIEAETNGPDISYVDFYVDGQPSHRDTVPSYCLFGGDGPCNFEALEAVPHLIEARVYDSFQNLIGATEMYLADGSVVSSERGGPGVSAVTLSAATVRVGESVSIAFSGPNLTELTYFDVRFRAPGSSVDEEARNWQKGSSAVHTLPAGTTPGTWIITGVRPHQDVVDHEGTFVTVSMPLIVVP